MTRHSGAARARLAGVLGVALGLSAALPDRLPSSDAAYLSVTGSTGNFLSDQLDAPTSLSASRPCTPSSGAPSFRSATSAAMDGQTQVVVPRPSGVVAGDLLVAVSEVSDDTAGDNADIPSGWSSVTSVAYSSGNFQVRVFRKVAGASEPTSYTFSGYDGSGGDSAVVVILAYSGADTSAPIGAVASQMNGSSTNAVAPSVSVSAAPATLLTILSVVDEDTVSTPPGMTVRASATSIDPQDLVAVFDEVRSVIGATGARTGTLAETRESIGVSLVLRAAPATVDPTVSLSWTPTIDAWATGYELVRIPGSGVSGTSSIAGAATAAHVDGTTTAGQSYTYELRAAYASWTSTAATAAVSAC